MKYTHQHFLQLKSKMTDVLILEKNISFLKSKFSCGPFGPIIIIGTKGRKYEIIAALIHEYGHFISFQNKENPKPDLFKKFFQRDKSLTQMQINNIVEEEKRAWKYGFQFLKQSGFAANDDIKFVRNTILKYVNQQAKSIT